eukprot:Lithocolla_globosa_v1_NODE_95_length_6502_cov_31.661238.p2 type:complete len:342 gc:universal NODE_95_length_6502_cov_31.661238:3139-2114(-)
MAKALLFAFFVLTSLFLPTSGVKPYSEDVRWRVVIDALGGMSYRAVASKYRLSSSVVGDYVSLFRSTGDVSPLPYPGKPRLLNVMELEGLEEVVIQNPTFYLDEIRRDFFRECGVLISVTCVSVSLLRLGLTRHKIERIARQRDRYLRACYLSVIFFYNRDQLVFLDETGCDRRTIQRTHGYHIRGRPLRLKHGYYYRGVRHSTITAMNSKSILAARVFVGTGTAEIFLAFLQEKLIPCLSVYPGPNSVVVLDNASIHHDPRVRELIEGAGARLVYLSPYSPDFNPCELTYDWIKDWLKREETWVETQVEINNGSLEYPLLKAFGLISPELCAVWFDRCYL